MFLHVPFNRPHQPFLEFRFPLPAQLGADFFRVHAVSPVVAGAVFHRGDKGVRLSEDVEDAADEVSIGYLTVAADVVDLSVFALLEDQVDGSAVVFHVEPVPHVFPVAVEGDGTV